MYSCVAWAAAFAAGWGLILAWHVMGGGMPNLLANGLAYAVLAIIAMGVAGRCTPKWHPALKRVAALLACAILAGIDVGLAGQSGEAAQKLFFAALLGIAVVVLAARHAPAGLRRKWLGEGGA